ncbi:putative tRNA (uracil-O(2)-)-methyltransferase [Megachile rotundata]|uniref:putative tRNA (uracil-O(2)-)-methyltransferase n=1 Tax=Megachile rotundata TaxID=143995 RepID=UPI000258D44F|nr:PREDICTED: probable tRNA (uracil-O(2)-)-methyltransferase [Megachile rotundata]
MDCMTIISEEPGGNASQFHKAVNIWSHNPQAINRNILASSEILNIEINCDIFEIFNRINTLDVSLLSREDQSDSINGAKLLYILHISQTSDVDSNKNVWLYVTKQLPRMPHIFSAGIEFLLLEKQENYTINIHKPLSEKRPLGPRIPYTIQQKLDKSLIGVYKLNTIQEQSSIEWLQKKLFPCILKWMKNESKNVSTLSSLSFISAEKYAKLYCQLKEKYGMNLIKNWPENTDPLKFVYEDIAIAAYLLLVWEKERTEKGTNDLQSFLDLGCGNGLLVHILFSEGHRGLGIDLRRRKIWDFYPPETPLQVSTVIPSSATVYTGYDWIIGNHSDELTPWIPVIAARSDCRFFLLPCCPYELNGTKYQRCCASKSQYSEYIEYVKNLSNECGFKTYLDKLRIPSTKRICLIGWERIHEERSMTEDRIQRLLSEKTTLIREEKEKTISEWTCDFKPRDTVERVRNCTQLDKMLIKNIVDTVANQLLNEGRVISLEKQSRTWNAGRCLELGEIAESIPRETMLRLRKECGGLQTLLRNHSHIFCVAKGKVQFKVPGTKQQVRRPRKNFVAPRTKTKPCWFHENHPNGCPAIDTECNYKH